MALAVKAAGNRRLLCAFKHAGQCHAVTDLRNYEPGIVQAVLTAAVSTVQACHTRCPQGFVM